MGTSTNRFVLDKTGFPLIWVKSVKSYVHFLPITKIQTEAFIAHYQNTKFNDGWYAELLSLNPRISPQFVGKNDYWRLFITGVFPSEAGEIAMWFKTADYDYSFPSVSTWMLIYNETKEERPIANISAIPVHNERIRLLVKKACTISKEITEENNRPYTLADQMFLRYGVLEWTVDDHNNQKWGGMGQTDANFEPILAVPESGKPQFPKNPHQDRIYYYGFRLLRRR